MRREGVTKFIADQPRMGRHNDEPPVPMARRRGIRRLQQKGADEHREDGRQHTALTRMRPQPRERRLHDGMLKKFIKHGPRA